MTELTVKAAAAYRKGGMGMVDLVKLLEYVAESGGTSYQLTLKAAEANVQLLFSSMLLMSVRGIRYTIEESGSLGRVDFTVVLSDRKRVVLEFKVKEASANVKASAKEIETEVRGALKQIVTRRYRHLSSFVQEHREPADVAGYGFVIDSKLRLLGWGQQTGDNGEVIIDGSVSEASRV